MSKNKGIEDSLPKKVELKKIAKDEEILKEKVEELHKEEIPVAKVDSPKNNTKRKPKKAITSQKEENVRITIDLPKSLHKKLKIYAVMNEVTIREYVVGLLSKSLKNK